jgi:hypothetical protein
MLAVLGLEVDQPVSQGDGDEPQRRDVPLAQRRHQGLLL